MNTVPFPEYLTYDDVLLVPGYAEVTPSHIVTDSFLTNAISLSVPIVAAPMDTVCDQKLALAMGKLGAYGIIHRNMSVQDQADQLRFVLSHGVHAGSAVGVGSDFDERITALIHAGAQELCVDSSHGHTKHVIEAVKHIRTQHPHIQIVAGNVATYEGAHALFEAGADAIKVGIGPGAICTTRVVAGVGVPQLSAVIICAKAAKEHNKHIIADGGIRTSGDIVKALAAGASAVMLGGLLAATDEAPGEQIVKDGKTYKSYRGMGSVGAVQAGSTRYGTQAKDESKIIAEGVEGLVPHKGPVETVIHQLVGGLKSGMGYVGAATIKELHEKANFVKITHASLIESHPHDLFITNPGRSYGG